MSRYDDDINRQMEEHFFPEERTSMTLKDRAREEARTKPVERAMREIAQERAFREQRWRRTAFQMQARLELSWAELERAEFVEDLPLEFAAQEGPIRYEGLLFTSECSGVLKVRDENRRCPRCGHPRTAEIRSLEDLGRYLDQARCPWDCRPQEDRPCDG